MNKHRLALPISYFLAVIILPGCGSSNQAGQSGVKQKTTESPRKVVRLEYASSLEPYVDDQGSLVIPGQRLKKWSGRTFVGSSSYDLVPID
jgi:hypothetical protein